MLERIKQYCSIIPVITMLLFYLSFALRIKIVSDFYGFAGESGFKNVSLRQGYEGGGWSAGGTMVLNQEKLILLRLMQGEYDFHIWYEYFCDN